MKSSIEKPFRRAFILTKEDVQRLAGLLQVHINTPKFDIVCADVRKRKFETVDELLAYDNSRSKAICSLTIRARSEDYKREAMIRLGAGHTPISFDIEGDEDTVNTLSDLLEDRIDGMKPWYSTIARLDFVTLGFFTIFGGFGALIIAVAFKLISNENRSSNNTDDPRGTAIALLVMIGSIGTALAGGWLFNRLRSWIFPIAFFALGQGANRLNKLEKIHWGILLSFLVSFLASVAVYLFPSHKW